MVKKFALVMAISVFLLSGCATGRKQKDLEIQGLRNQVSVLEAQIQSKDEEINSLKEALGKSVPQEEKNMRAASFGKKRRRMAAEVKSRPNIRQIQVTLKNAGYDPGVIDGRMGKQTKEAIKAFQLANNLPADGRVGRQTWNLLRKYLYQKVK